MHHGRQATVAGDAAAAQPPSQSSAAYHLGGQPARPPRLKQKQRATLEGPQFEWQTYMTAATLCIGAATLAEAVSPPHVDNLLVTYAAAAVAFCLAEGGYAPFMLQTCA